MNFILRHLEVLLAIAAITQAGVAVINIFLVRLMRWRDDLSGLPLLVREVFHVHCWFISLTLMIFAVTTSACRFPNFSGSFLAAFRAMLSGTSSSQIASSNSFLSVLFSSSISIPIVLARFVGDIFPYSLQKRFFRLPPFIHFRVVKRPLDSPLHALVDPRY